MNNKKEISKAKSPFCYSSPVLITYRRMLQYMQRIQLSAGAGWGSGGKGAEDIYPKKSKRGRLCAKHKVGGHFQGVNIRSDNWGRSGTPQRFWVTLLQKVQSASRQRQG